MDDNQMNNNDDTNDLHNPQVTPPAVHDEQAASGSAPDPTSDDDVDQLGEEAGLEYGEEEELGINDKVRMETEAMPPEEDYPGDEASDDGY